jgi:hypothetical protein
MSKLFIIIVNIILLAGITSCNNLNSPMDNNPMDGTVLPTPVGPLKGGEVLSGIVGLYASPLAIDKDNILWIGTYNSIVALHDNQFQTFDLYNTRIPHSSVSQILVDKSNKKWFGTGSGDIFTFDNQKWDVLLTPEKISSISAIRQDKAGNIWVIGQKEYVSNSGKNDAVMWSYKNGVVDKIMDYDFTNKYPFDFIVDKENNFWILMGGGMVKYNGQTWEDITSQLPMKGTAKISYDDKNDILYLFSNRQINNNALISEGGITLYKNGKFEVIATEKTGLPANQYISALSTDRSGNVWIGYDQKPTSVAKFDGKEWVTFSSGMPNYLGNKVLSIMEDNKGQIWMGGTTASPQGSCLARLDGTKWIGYPISMEDPRLWWRKKSLAELYQLPVSKTGILDVMKDPISHRNEKIRIIGAFESSFEYSNIIDTNGNKLNIWPDSSQELSKFIDDNGWIEKRTNSGPPQLQKTSLKEIIGFLELGGGFGHGGGWPYRLYITELYPYGSQEENQKAHDVFAGFVNSIGQDDQAIRSIITQWATALRSADIEALKKVYSSDSPRLRSLMDTNGQEYVKNNKMDINIKDLKIYIQGGTARVNIIEVTVFPDKYFTPTGNVKVIGDGLYKLRSIDLVKSGSDWKIKNYDYSPEYELPSIPTPPAPTPTK